MASIEFIEKRIAGKKAELDKLEKKLARILKAKESNYEANNPYYYSDYDLRVTEKEIATAKSSIETYESNLAAEMDKSQSRNIQVILDFLDSWKETVFNAYKKGLEKYFAERDSVSELAHSLDNIPYGTPEYDEAKAKLSEARAAFRTKCNGEFEEIPPTSPRYSRWNHRVKVKNGEYEWLKQYSCRGNLEEALSYLTKDLDVEAARKYDDIIERTNKYVGQITDASGLSIGFKGELNGIIEGTRGKVKVETIGAGGYNQDIIVNEKHGQIFHFRTLINPIK